MTLFAVQLPSNWRTYTPPFLAFPLAAAYFVFLVWYLRSLYREDERLSLRGGIALLLCTVLAVMFIWAGITSL